MGGIYFYHKSSSWDTKFLIICEIYDGFWHVSEKSSVVHCFNIKIGFNKLAFYVENIYLILLIEIDIKVRNWKLNTHQKTMANEICALWGWTANAEFIANPEMQINLRRVTCNSYTSPSFKPFYLVTPDRWGNICITI